MLGLSLKISNLRGQWLIIKSPVTTTSHIIYILSCGAYSELEKFNNAEMDGPGECHPTQLSSCAASPHPHLSHTYSYSADMQSNCSSIARHSSPQSIVNLSVPLRFIMSVNLTDIINFNGTDRCYHTNNSNSIESWCYYKLQRYRQTSHSSSTDKTWSHPQIAWAGATTLAESIIHSSSCHHSSNMDTHNHTLVVLTDTITLQRFWKILSHSSSCHHSSNMDTHNHTLVVLTDTITLQRFWKILSHTSGIDRYHYTPVALTDVITLLWYWQTSSHSSGTDRHHHNPLVLTDIITLQRERERD